MDGQYKRVWNKSVYNRMKGKCGECEECDKCDECENAGTCLLFVTADIQLINGFDLNFTNGAT